jgi:hypothetical protein
MNNEFESRDAELRRWRVSSSLNPRFKTAVWRRIAAESQVSSPVTVWQWLEGVLRGPRLAFSYLAVMALVGGGVGFWKGNETAAEQREASMQRYIQSVDPYQRVLNR